MLITTMKLFSPLYAQLNERNEWGDLDYDSVDMDSEELCAYQDTILEAIEQENQYLDAARGLAVYMDDALLKRKVHSMKPTVEEWDGRLWGVLEVQSYGPLSESELDEVMEEWSGQESDGWGENFEQREIRVDSGELCISFWKSGNSFFIKTEQELKTGQPYHCPRRMQVRITADEYKGKRGYDGADVELPASRFGLADALQRAHVPEGDGYELHSFEKWPGFLSKYLTHAGDKTLSELNLLAGKVSEMDEFQLEIYEGALKLRQDGDIDHPVSIRELINYAYNLDSFEFHPGVVDDRDLGRIVMMGGMLDTIDDLPEEAAELLDEQKVGEAMRKADQGAFTESGYVYRSSNHWQEVYDGIHLPELPEERGLISLRLAPVNGRPEENSGVWLELPAGEQAVKRALDALGESSLDSCVIAEADSILPSLKYQLAGDEAIDKLNTLAERLAAFPDSKTLMKCKAVMELECYPDLDRMLDITQNLDCYDFDRMDISPAAYAEYLLKEGGVNVDDPAFSRFDFQGYGEREMEGGSFIMTPYGSIARSDMPFVQEYTKLQRGMTMT
nr:hypothetical protein [uncultured Eisenbergiella sp.]